MLVIADLTHFQGAALLGIVSPLHSSFPANPQAEYLRQERLILDRLCLSHLVNKRPTPGPSSQRPASTAASGPPAASQKRDSLFAHAGTPQSPARPPSSRPAPAPVESSSHRESEFDWPPTNVSACHVAMSVEVSPIKSPARPSSSRSPASVSLGLHSPLAARTSAHVFVPPPLRGTPATLTEARELTRSARNNAPGLPHVFPSIGASETPLPAARPASPVLRAPAPRAQAPTHADLSGFAFPSKRPRVDVPAETPKPAPAEPTIVFDDMEWPDLEEGDSSRLFARRK